MRRTIFGLLVTSALVFAVGWGCSDDDPAKPSGNTETHLAGGGRSSSDDPFSGGPGESGPTHPGFEIPDGRFIPLFYADLDCQNAPGGRLITSAEDWQAWWTLAIACLTPAAPGGMEPGGGRPVGGLAGLHGPARLMGSASSNGPARLAAILGDSGWVEPDTTHPYPPEAPPVDFETQAVVVISLEPDTLPGRGVWVTEVEATESGSTVTYQVWRLGEDCYWSGWRGESQTLSPTIAVLVPGPMSEPITWVPEEVVYDCSWEPDPNEPLCVYYTDADCELGPQEAVLRDRESFEAWLAAAFACDQARWLGGDSIVVVYPDGRVARGDSGSAGGDTIIVPSEPPAPYWIDVDFSTHAVLILRAGERTRWGGGIWLDTIETSAGGSVIGYTAVVPGSECPEVEGGALNPTVAIRVPLPLAEPVVWNRRTEMVECRWDSGGTEPDPGIGPRPMGMAPGVRPQAWRR